MARPKSGEFNGPNYDTQTGAKIARLGTKVYKYWTNFDRAHREDFEVIQEPKKGYWQFVTNLEPSDFEYGLGPREIRNFLYKMEDIYKVRKIEA